MESIALVDRRAAGVRPPVRRSRSFTPLLARCEPAFAVAAACGWLGVVASGGGLHGRVGLVGLGTVIPLLVSVLASGRLAIAPLVLLATLGSGAFVALETGAPGWRQSAGAGALLYGALAFVAVFGFCRSSSRRLAVVLAIAVVGVVEFGLGLTPWWGSADPHNIMVGTFYWHNQFGAFELATAVVAAGVYLFGQPPFRKAAGVAAVLAASGAVFSASRAVLALAAVCCLVLGLMAWRQPARKAALFRLLAFLSGTFVVLVVLSGPPFFPGFHTGSVLSGFHRQQIDTLSFSGTTRFAYDGYALRSWLASPLLGHGFGSFGPGSVQSLPLGSELTNYTHNAFLEAFSDGGVLYGGPLLVIGIGMTVGLLARLRTSVLISPASPVIDATDVSFRGVLGLVGGMLIAHSLVDFDWHYCGLTGLMGAVAGAALAREEVPEPPASARRTILSAVTVSLVALLCATALFGDIRTRDYSPPRTNSVEVEVVSLLNEAQAHGLADPYLAARALNLALTSTPSLLPALSVGPTAVARAVAQTARLQDLEPHVAMQRAQAEILLGGVDEGLDVARRTVAKFAAHRPYLYGDLVVTLALAGQPSRGLALGAAQVQSLAHPSSPARASIWSVVQNMELVDGGAWNPVTTCAFSAAATAFGSPPPSVSTPPVVPPADAAQCRPDSPAGS